MLMRFYISIILLLLTLPLSANIKSFHGWNGTIYNELTVNGGFKDEDVSTAIKLGDSSNTSLNTTNKTIVGSINELEQQLISVTDKSANATAALVDVHKVIEYTNSTSDYTYTLPQNSEVAFSIGSWIEIRKTGTGDITITKGAGTTFRGVLGDVSVDINGEDGYSVFIEKTATNTWLISGSVKAI